METGRTLPLVGGSKIKLSPPQALIKLLPWSLSIGCDTFGTLAYPGKQKAPKITRIIRALGLAKVVGRGNLNWFCIFLIYMENVRFIFLVECSLESVPSGGISVRPKLPFVLP